MEMMANMMMAMGKSQQMASQWTQWLQSGGKSHFPWMPPGFDAMPTAVPFAEAKADADPLWENYRKWLQMMGGVPIVDYNQLAEQLSELEKTCEQQQRTIESLQSLLLAKEELQNGFIENMNDYMDGQGKMLQELFGHFMSTLKPEPTDEPTQS